jgi:protein-S-isoprenylcysteine O-methyltransferase Ste14
MSRLAALVCGVAVYFFFFGVFLYLLGFLENKFVPKSIDSGTLGPVGAALSINIFLVSVFAIQHSVMARPAFKRIWTRVIPRAIERSTYVLLSSLALILLMAFWKPVPTIIWDVRNSSLGTGIIGIQIAGWFIVLASTFMIDHFDLVGIRQVYCAFRQQELNRGRFRKRFFYKLVRHLIMTGFLIAFWATPMMTIGHLIFSLGMTIYIYVAVKIFEERDLIIEIGQPYIDYQSEVGPFFPGIGKRAANSTAATQIE